MASPFFLVQTSVVVLPHQGDINMAIQVANLIQIWYAKLIGVPW
jgi:hypothetical protein